jgi:DNA-binding NarL/FixJ family response regulator
MQPIYKDKQIVDWNDEGEQQHRIESAIDFKLFTKRLIGFQQDILKLKEEGYNNKEIAEQLGSTPKTVAKHLTIIKELYGKIK